MLHRPTAIGVGLAVALPFVGADGFSASATPAATGQQQAGQQQAGQDQAAMIDRAVERLPKLVRRAMRRTGVPGVAVAVVHNDEVVLRRGFGVRNSKKSRRVTPSTVFQVASVSKPLGAAAVAQAVGDKVVRWQDPVRKHLPAFQLSDPWVGDHVTIADLYSHRSGLPGNAGNDLETFGFERAQILPRLALEPLDPFRITYAYSNFGMTTAGQAVADADGSTFEAMTRKRLFRPLGMRHSSFSHADFLQQKNRAALHQERRGKWVPAVQRNPDPQAPAGGASSSADDMARWIRMELREGRFDGKRVIKRSALQQALSLQIRTSDPAAAADEIRGYGFGMGVEVDDTGRVRMAHSGAFSDGAATRIMMIPDLDLGLVILTNGWPVGLPEAVANEFAEIAEHGKVQTDWLQITREAFSYVNTAPFAIDGKKRPKNPQPARDVAGLVGTYRNDYLGDVRVESEAGRLVVRVGPQGKTALRLRHWNGDRFFYNEVRMPAGFWEPVTFSGTGAGGEASTMDLGGVNSDLGILQRVAG